MKQIKLMELVLRNFKGVKDFRLVVDGDNAQVFGDNATGKTTLFDAFIWGMFDKDSNDKKDFQLKTVDPNGKELHFLEHQVVIVLEVEGERIEFQKVFTEKWTKKRGSAHKEFSGHTTDYYLNSVPSKKKEYEEKIKSIMDEEVFKLLTSPTYFNESLHWNKKRELLLEISGAPTDEEVIESNENLKDLMGVVAKRTIEDHKKMVSAKRSEINKELDRIPVRIDEVHRSMADTSGLSKEKLNDELSALLEKGEAKERELNQILNGVDSPEKQSRILHLKTNLSEDRQAYREKQFGEINMVRDKMNTQADVVRNTDNDVKSLFHTIERKQDTLAMYESSRDQLRAEWKRVNEEAFDEHTQSCPTCEQDLPKEQVESAHEQFNLHKSKRLEDINQKGKDLKGKSDDLELEIKNLNVRLDNLKAKLETEKVTGKMLKSELDALTSQQAAPFEETDQYKTAQSEIQSLEADIQRAKDNAEESAQDVRKAIRNLKDEMQSIQTDLAKFDQREKSEQRVAELEAEEKRLAKEFEQIEQDLFLIEEFTRSKVELLEEKINGKFKHARFKLFEEQINGGLKETCETLFEGVPYSKGLNNAAKINIGLDIINTLNDHFGVAAPIFVDNSEAVTRLLDIDTQIISLVVSEADKSLRVEKKRSDIIVDNEVIA